MRLIHLEVRDVDLLHQRLELMTTARASTGEAENLLWHHRPIIPLRHRIPCSPLLEVLGSLHLVIIRDHRASSDLLFWHIVWSSHEAECDILVEGPIIRSHVPLWVGLTAHELEERVARGIIDGHGEWLERDILDLPVLRLLKRFPDVIVIHAHSTRIILFSFLEPDEISQIPKHPLDLLRRSRVHDPSNRLANVQIADSIP